MTHNESLAGSEEVTLPPSCSGTLVFDRLDHSGDVVWLIHRCELCGGEVALAEGQPSGRWAHEVRGATAAA